jgi:hypothetical protein
MQPKLQEFARHELKAGLAKCTEDQQLLFKRMYSHKNPTLPIDEVVDRMPVGKLENAMDQVERTVIKNQKAAS